jgi:hypothetical protein
VVAWPLAAQALQRRPVINSSVAYEAISNASSFRNSSDLRRARIHADGKSRALRAGLPARRFVNRYRFRGAELHIGALMVASDPFFNGRRSYLVAAIQLDWPRRNLPVEPNYDYDAKFWLECSQP